jgi:SulP family sulfate permease
VAIRMDGGLFFATSDALEDRVRHLIHATPGLTGIVLDCGGINFVDSQGAAKLGDVIDLAEESGLTLRLARLKPNVRSTLERDAIVERLGEDHVHGSVFRAVQAQLEEPTGPSKGTST